MTLHLLLTQKEEKVGIFNMLLFGVNFWFISQLNTAKFMWSVLNFNTFIT